MIRQGTSHWLPQSQILVLIIGPSYRMIWDFEPFNSQRYLSKCTCEYWCCYSIPYLLFLSALNMAVRFGIWSLLTVSTTNTVPLCAIGKNNPYIFLLPLKNNQLHNYFIVLAFRLLSVLRGHSFFIHATTANDLRL